MESTTNYKKTMCEERGEHKYFVATDVAVEREGKVAVILCCTRCGDPLMHLFKVSDAVKNQK